MAHGRLRRGGRVDVVTRVRQQVRELALHTRDDQVARSAFRRGQQRVLGAPRILQRVGDLVLCGEHDRVAEIELGEHQRIRGGVLVGDLRELRRLLAPHQVVGEVEKVDRDARLKERVFDLRQDLVQLGPGQVKRLEVLEAAGPQHSPLEQGKEPLGVGARERRKGLLPQGRHACITP